jgi:hypothetical protein
MMSASLNNTDAISVLFLFTMNVGYLALFFNQPLKFEYDKVEGRC